VGEVWETNPFLPAGAIDPMTRVAELVLRSRMAGAVCEMVFFVLEWWDPRHDDIPNQILTATHLKHHHVFRSFFSLLYL
jgi:hypothetical protein